MTHDELRDYLDNFDCAGMVNEPAIKALRAVVELPLRPELRFREHEYEMGSIDGYNQCLADVKSAIEKELK